MALTKIKRTGLDTGITDNSDANAITIDSSENTTFAGKLSVSAGANQSAFFQSNSGQKQVVIQSPAWSGNATNNTISALEITNSESTPEVIFNITGSGNATLAGDILIDKPSGGNITIDSGGGDGYLQFKNASSVRWSIGRDNTDNALVFNYGDGLGSSGGQLKLAPTSGNATFAGDVTTSRTLISNANYQAGANFVQMTNDRNDNEGGWVGFRKNKGSMSAVPVSGTDMGGISWHGSDGNSWERGNWIKSTSTATWTEGNPYGKLIFGVRNSTILTLENDSSATFTGSISATHYNGAYITNGNIGDANSGGTQKFGGNGRTHWGGHMLSYGGNAGGKVEFNTGTSGTGTLALTIDSSQNTHFKGNIYIDKADGQFFLQNGNGANRAYIQYQESADDLIISSLEAGSDIKFLPAGNTALTLYDDLSATFAGNMIINGSSSRQIEFKDGSTSEGAIVFDENDNLGLIFKVGGTSGSSKKDALKIESDAQAIFTRAGTSNDNKTAVRINSTGAHGMGLHVYSNTTNDSNPLCTIEQANASSSMPALRVIQSGDGDAAWIGEGGGNVGMGTTAPTGKLHIDTSSDGDISLNMGAGGARSGVIVTDANMFINASYANGQGGNGVIAFGMNRQNWGGGVEVMRLLESGRVGIGTTEPGNTFQVGGTSNAGQYLRVNSNGLMYSPVTYTTGLTGTNRGMVVQQSNGEIGYDNTSSIIAKINVEDLDTSILSFLNELNPVTYNYRKKDEYGKFTNEPEEQERCGLIAEDVRDLCKKYGLEDSNYWQDGVDGTAEYIHYQEFITPLIKAMQELSAKVEALENA